MKLNKYLISFLFIIPILTSSITEFDIASESTSKSFTKLFESNLRPRLLTEKEEASEDMCLRRVNPLDANYYYFFPNIKARLFKEGDNVEFKGGCFNKNHLTLKKLTKEETIIELDSSDKNSFFCQDIYIIHTSNINQFKALFTSGKHTIILKNLSEDDLDEIKVNSIKLVGFCSGVIETLKSLYMTLKMYVGGLGYDPNHKIPLFRPHVPDYMIKANMEALKFYMNYEPEIRNSTPIYLDESTIHTGDFLAISRMDGIDPMIMMGTGSHIGHSAVAAWIDGELYVLESQDGPYWPTRGIQRTPFKKWVEQADISEFNVAILPMREEYRKKFNESKAVEWFVNGIEGLPYGYEIFLWGWIDTVDSNMPWAITHLHFEFLFTVLEKIYPSLADQMMAQSLNIRLGTKKLKLTQIIAEAARRNITFEELLAMPEQDYNKYDDGTEKYTCAVFVASFLKAGGLFNGFTVNAQEFTPKDIVQLDIWDHDWKDNRPQICKDRDPELPYCQILGKYRVDSPGYSSVPIYDHMNERCPSIGPDYYRPPNC